MHEPAEDIIDVSGRPAAPAPQPAAPDPAAAAAESERRAEEQAADDATFAAPKTPAEYQIPYGTTFAERDMSAQDLQTDATLRGWLHDAQLPAYIGNDIAEQADLAQREAPSMTDAEAELAMRRCETDLRGLWGRELADKRMDLARRLVREIDAKRPGLVAFLEDHPAIANHPRVVMQLALHAERIYARKGAK
ncbi:MAG: hypothetical protein C3F19_09410 [Rhodocyclales bacterium]|nr:MAG: hypothetical protein C3F19_09410 [Rhodocyclales bacterium]